MSIIVFDTETTASEPGQICQLAYLLIDGPRVTGRNLFFAVDGMTERAFRVHGLSRERLETLSGGRRFADEAASVFADFAAADCLAGHSVAADVRFLSAELARCDLNLGEKEIFCTRDFFVRMRRERDGARVGWPSLTRLAQWYGLTPETIAARCEAWFQGGGAAHDARYDAAAVWLILLEAARRGELTGAFAHSVALGGAG